MKIQSFLKTMNITKQDLANALKISRPTLDVYINLYENDLPLPKERYQLAFDRLFTHKIESSTVFKKEVQALSYLLDSEKQINIDCLSNANSDIIIEIIKLMIVDSGKKDSQQSIYEFILYLLKNYNRSASLSHLADFYSYLYSNNVEYKIPTTNAGYFVKFYIFFKFLDSLSFPPKYDKKDLDELIQHKRQLVKSNHNKIHKNMKDLERLLQEINKEMIDDGTPLTKEEILKLALYRIQ